MSASVDLTGQVVLVTGASAGLGRQFSRVLAAAGATVGVGARRPLPKRRRVTNLHPSQHS